MNKRKAPAAADGMILSNKRARGEDGDNSDDNRVPPIAAKTRADPVSGQKAAFPGLDDGPGDDLFHGPATDGLEYLRMVR